MDELPTEPPQPADVVNDATFDLLQALTSSLEALDAYREYASLGTDPVFASLVESERQQATKLLGALRARLVGGGRG